MGVLRAGGEVASEQYIYTYVHLTLLPSLSSYSAALASHPTSPFDGDMPQSLPPPPLP